MLQDECDMLLACMTCVALSVLQCMLWSSLASGGVRNPSFGASTKFLDYGVYVPPRYAGAG